MLHHDNIKHLEPVDPLEMKSDKFLKGYRVFDNQEANEVYAKEYGGAKRRTRYDSVMRNGKLFKVCCTSTRDVHSLEEVMTIAKSSNLGTNMDRNIETLSVNEACNRRYVCYVDITDPSTERYVTVWVKRISM